MSLCDRCQAPGLCCRSIFLSCHGIDHSDPQGWMSRYSDELCGSYPFVLQSVDESKEGPGRYRWSCPKLTPEGRCGIYETRPFPCRHYPPREDGLCAHYWHEPGDGSAGDWALDDGWGRRGPYPGRVLERVDSSHELTCPPPS